MNAECKRAGQVGYMDFFPNIHVPGFNMDLYNKRFYEANVIINAKSKLVHYGNHWGGLSVKCAFSGPEFYKSGDTMYRVDDESFLIFNEGKEYSSWIDSRTDVSSFTLNMSPAFEQQALAALLSMSKGLIDDPADAGRIRFTERLYPHQPRITGLVTAMRSLAPDVAVHHLRLQELFFELFLEMIRLQQDSDRQAMATGKVTAASRQELFKRLVRARDFIHSCYERDVSLNELAEVACLNPCYFLREFKKAFGITPHQYLTQRRISVARQLLSNGQTSVSDVCLLVGFRDQSSFSKLFRRHTGQSPTEFCWA